MTTLPQRHYVATIRHPWGVLMASVQAPDPDAARQRIAAFEGCALTDILKLEEITQ